jgi:hypothetical protein
MIDRRAFLTLLGLGALTSPLAADAQSAAKLVHELRFTGQDGDRVGFRAHGAVSGNRNVSRIISLSRLLYIYTPYRCLCKHLEGVDF